MQFVKARLVLLRVRHAWAALKNGLADTALEVWRALKPEAAIQSASPEVRQYREEWARAFEDNNKTLWRLKNDASR